MLDGELRKRSVYSSHEPWWIGEPHSPQTNIRQPVPGAIKRELTTAMNNVARITFGSAVSLQRTFEWDLVLRNDDDKGVSWARLTLASITAIKWQHYVKPFRGTAGMTYWSYPLKRGSASTVTIRDSKSQLTAHQRLAIDEQVVAPQRQCPLLVLSISIHAQTLWYSRKHLVVVWVVVW